MAVWGDRTRISSVARSPPPPGISTSTIRGFRLLGLGEGDRLVCILGEADEREPLAQPPGEHGQDDRIVVGDHQGRPV